MPAEPTRTAGNASVAATSEPAGHGWRRAWSAAWPKAAAGMGVVAVWQVASWSGLGPSVLQSPGTVARTLWRLLADPTFWGSCRATAGRAADGFAVAVAVGAVVGAAIARVPALRSGAGPLVTGLQTMPSALWYPFAVLVCGPTSGAIVLMMALGGSTAVANGVLAGVDQVPVALVRSGRAMGARGFALQRHVVLPAALPGVLGGLKQGWAFSWHALMSGEFLLRVGGLPGLGARTDDALAHGRYATVVALMIVIAAVGVAVDVAFGRVDVVVRRRHGLLGKPTDQE